jgi:O-antigen/teichoic acid export membrane protein
MIIFNTNAIRALKLIKMFAYMEFFPSFSNLLVLILLTLVAYQREVPIYARLSSFLITGLASWFVMEYAFKRMAKDGDRIHPLPMRSILKVSVPMFLTSTMYLVMGQIGVLMIGAFRTEAEVGYFSVAVKLATLSSFVINTINTIAAPKFSELYYSKKFDDLFYVARKAAKLVLWTTFPIIIGLLVFGMLVLKYIFGSEFSVAYPAMAIMLSGQLVISMLGSAEKFLNMTGQQKTLGYILIGGTLANVILNFILIPIYGILGASLATVCGNLFWNISAMIYIKAHYGKSIAYIPGFLRRPRNIKFGQ